MPHVEPIVDVAGALTLLTASMSYRLAGLTRYAPAVWGGVAALTPALTGGRTTWRVAAFLGATAICAVASAHASRTRIAQLSLGWWMELEHEVERERDRGQR